MPWQKLGVEHRCDDFALVVESSWRPMQPEPETADEVAGEVALRIAVPGP